MHVPWIALLALAIPLPFRRAAPVHLAAVVLSLTAVEARWRLSHAQCPLSGARHSAMVQAAADAAAWLLHPAPGSGRGGGQQPAPLLGGRASFYAVFYASHLVAACLTLHLLHRWEARARRAFARQPRGGGSGDAAGPSTAAAAAAPRGMCHGLVAGGRELLPTALCCAVWVGCLLHNYSLN